MSTSLLNLGSCLSTLGKYEEAKPYLEEAIELSRELNHTRALAAALGNLGGILTEEERHEEALRLYQQGLEIHRQTGYRIGLALALDNVGTAHFYMGNDREALHTLRESVREARDLGADYIALDALVCLAGLRARRGEKETALAWFGLIHNHPKADIESRKAVEKLFPQVAEGMRAQAALAAQERGKALDLNGVINEVLK